MTHSDLALTSCSAEQLTCSAEDPLLLRLHRGDGTAFDELYEEYHGLVFNLAFRLLGKSDEASDLTQEVYLSVFRNIRRFQGESSLRTWIYRITINACINRNRWWKRQRRETTLSLDEPTVGSRIPSMSGSGGANGSPEDDVYRGEISREIQRGLGRLRPDQRVTVVLRDIEGLSYEEIAETLAVSVGTVKSRIARGRELLRKQLHDLLQEQLRAGRDRI